MNRRETRKLLPAANGGVDTDRIDFYAVADPPGTLCRYESSAAPQERIKHDVAACGRLRDRVDYELYWLDCGIGSGIAPDIRPSPTAFTKHVIAVAACIALEH